MRFLEAVVARETHVKALKEALPGEAPALKSDVVAALLSAGFQETRGGYFWHPKEDITVVFDAILREVGVSKENRATAIPIFAARMTYSQAVEWFRAAAAE